MKNTNLTWYREHIPRLSSYLNKQEEIILFLKAKNNRIDYENFFYYYYNFAILFVLRYKKTSVEIEDLISVSFIGLLDAFNRFNVTKGNCFLTYAKWRIRRRCQVEVEKNGNLIRIPRNAENPFSIVPINKINTDKFNYNPVSKIENKIDNNKVGIAIKEAIDELKLKNPKYAKVIISLYGFNGKCLKSKDLAENFKISRQMVNKMERKALKILKEILLNNLTIEEILED